MALANDELMLGFMPPNVPGYREFRMMAEWASAVRGEWLGFTYDPVSGRMDAREPADGHEPVFTQPDAVRLHPVDRVEFTVLGRTCSLSGTECSALFWSESSVEKFLFPCLASASADDAARFLGRLSSAWYGYPGKVVQVCALAYQFGTSAPSGSLSLEAAVKLVCWEQHTGEVTVLGLGEFERTYATGAARGFGACGVTGLEPERLTGWTAARVDSVVVREAAEFVSGLRGHYVRFTYGEGVLTPWVYPTEYPGPAPENAEVVSEGVTLAVRPDRPYPSKVAVYLAGGEGAFPIVPRGTEAPADPTREPDSMFWTDGAVERLLLPYYASVKGGCAPYFTTLLMAKWNGWIGPDSTEATRAFAALEASLGSLEAASVDPSEVYAITHLPRSDYVTDGLAGGAAGAPALSHALEHRTALLTFAGGRFGSHPLLGA